MLLHWCTVKPESASDIAAIRFSAPIRISSLTIYPNGVQPFTQCPEIVAETQPAAFYLEVYFNATALQGAEKDKQRPPNALVPTSIAYTGDIVDFQVDLGQQYSTRLMIIKGPFQFLSFAIFGDVVSDSPDSLDFYSPAQSRSITPLALPYSIDPATSTDPTSTAYALLALLPDPPPLPLVIRLMFCLKPANDDWDDDEFPHIYADLILDTEDMDLDSVLDSLGRPIADDTSDDTLNRFGALVSRCIGSKTPQQALKVAELLRISASQKPHMASTLCQRLNSSDIFDADSMDTEVLSILLDAAANPDICQFLCTDSMLDSFKAIETSVEAEETARIAAAALEQRLRRWLIFEDSISNRDGNFLDAVSLLRDIGSSEQSLAIWLESMISNVDLSTKLLENPIPPSSIYPPSLLWKPVVNVSHEEFIAFIRVYMGVSSVLAVLAWADSVGSDTCRERSLAILRTWQNVEGYSEVVNYLLTLRQFTRRLDWITSDNDSPRKSGLLGEQIILGLAEHPRAFLSQDVCDTILNLAPPLSFISEMQRASMRKAALVVEDGLGAAIEEIAFSSDHPLSLRRLRTIRVSLALINQEIDKNGHWRVLEVCWGDQGVALQARLIDILAGISNDLAQSFALSSTSPPTQDVATQLFRAADDLLTTILRSSSEYIFTSRSLSILVKSLADIFTFTGVVNILFSQHNLLCKEAQVTRETCLNVISSLSATDRMAEANKTCTEIILRGLFMHKPDPVQDPLLHVLQIFTLVDHVLLDIVRDGAHELVTTILPNVLTELRSFFCTLEPENRAHMLKQLIRLDDGVTGVAEWLFGKELISLHDHLVALSVSHSSIQGLEILRDIHSYEVGAAIRFLLEIIREPPESIGWFTVTVESDPETMASCMIDLADLRCKSLDLTNLTLGLHSIFDTSTNGKIRFGMAMLCLNTFQQEHMPSLLPATLSILNSTPSTCVLSDILRRAIERVLRSLCRGDNVLPSEIVTGAVGLLQWLIKQDDTRYRQLYGINSEELQSLYGKLRSAYSSETVDDIQAAITIDEDDEDSFAAPEIGLPRELAISPNDLKALLIHTEPPLPSTPTKIRTPDILGVVISPPTALLRSPAATGLTKTYNANDFRELRQTPSTRQNTSRLPSKHVDDFEVLESPILDANFNPLQFRTQ